MRVSGSARYDYVGFELTPHRHSRTGSVLNTLVSVSLSRSERVETSRPVVRITIITKVTGFEGNVFDWASKGNVDDRIHATCVNRTRYLPTHEAIANSSLD